MYEQSHHMIDYIPFLGVIRRGDPRGTPMVTRWTERLLLPGLGVLWALWVSDHDNSKDIVAVKAEIVDIRQSNIQRDVAISDIKSTNAAVLAQSQDNNQALKSLQYMLSKELSRKQ